MESAFNWTQRKGKTDTCLEFRTPSAGPTIKDTMANVLFQIALVEYIASIEYFIDKISFSSIQKNFYSACKHSLDARVQWIDGKTYLIQELILNMFPQLKIALKKKGLSSQEIDHYLNDIILSRVKNKQNGANWQKTYIHTYGSRFQEMLESYYDYQKQNIPVHLWSV